MDKSQIEYRIEVEQDHVSVRGNAMASGDPEYDKQVEDEIIDRLNNGDIWAWACVCVVASYKGHEGRDYLACCNYENEQDFIKGGYYEDMKQQALADLIEKLKSASDAYTELIKKE